MVGDSAQRSNATIVRARSSMPAWMDTRRSPRSLPSDALPGRWWRSGARRRPALGTRRPGPAPGRHGPSECGCVSAGQPHPCGSGAAAAAPEAAPHRQSRDGRTRDPVVPPPPDTARRRVPAARRPVGGAGGRARGDASRGAARRRSGAAGRGAARPKAGARGRGPAIARRARGRAAAAGGGPPARAGRGPDRHGAPRPRTWRRIRSGTRPHFSSGRWAGAGGWPGSRARAEPPADPGRCSLCRRQDGVGSAPTRRRRGRRAVSMSARRSTSCRSRRAIGAPWGRPGRGGPPPAPAGRRL